MRSSSLALPLIFAAFGALAGCRGQTTEDSPIVPIRNMFNQPKYSMQQESEYFDDHRTMRPPVDGVISREEEIDPKIAHGTTDTGYVMVVPPEVVTRSGGMDAMLARGKERYGIYCTPCHGLTGAGDGIVVKRNVGMPPPPTYHQDRIRHMPDGQLFATIENGVRNMPAYGPQIPTQDRWAIVEYVRALQVSQAQAAMEKKP
jgi:mono/diheme cytochrome c family protein